MAKRKNNEGCYGTKSIKGTEYKFYRFPDGHYVYAKKTKDLEIKKQEYADKIEAGLVVKDNLFVFEDYCKIWLKQRRAYISERVYDDYESIIDSRIAKYPIGKMQIKSLTVNAFNMYFKELTTKYSKASIDKTYVVVKQVLKYGMEEKDIPVINLEKIIRPKETEVATKKKQVPFMTKEEIDLFTEEVEKDIYGNGAKVLLFILHTGLRISEAIGLKWKYVDNFESVKIEQSSAKTIERDKNLDAIKKDGKNVYKRIQKGTKSVDGQRYIPLTKKSQEILHFFYDNFPHSKDDYVFINANGKQFNPRTIERTLTTVLKNSKCERKDYTPHCLRHSFGSVLIQNGVDIKIVSELLGHSDVSFTYNTYIGTSQKDKSNAIKSVFDGT